MLLSLGAMRRIATGERWNGGSMPAHATPPSHLADHLLLLGPAGLVEVAGLLVVPDHVRRLVDGLADVGVAAASALTRVAGKLTGAQLDALAGVSVERLDELGLLGGPGAGPAGEVVR